MQSELKIPSPLRRFTAGKSILKAKSEILSGVLNELFKAYPDIKDHLMDDKGELRNFVNIFINGEDTRYGDGLNTKIKNGDDIRIIPSIAGGSADSNILSSKEVIRYSRHLSLPEVGIEGQKKIKTLYITLLNYLRVYVGIRSNL